MNKINISAKLPATRVVSYKVRQECTDVFKSWITSLNFKAAEFHGYVGSEILPPQSIDSGFDWTVIYRFESNEDLSLWLDSAIRKKGIKEVSKYLIEPETVFTIPGQNESNTYVTLITSHLVAPELISAYEAENNALNDIASSYSGFLGCEVHHPSDLNPEYTVIIRFDSRENMNRWLNSPERKSGLERLYQYTLGHQTKVIGTGFGQWFAVDRESSIAASPWKQAMVVLFALFPTVMFLNLSVGAFLEHREVPFALNVFIGNLLGTIVLTWVMMPVAVRIMGWWIAPRVSSTVTLLGVLTMLAVYVAEVLLFIVFG